MEDIPDPLIVNWAMKIVLASSWTIEKKGTKRVEIAATDGKRQITGMFACSLAGDFLPLQLVCERTTPRCLPKVNFPKDWHLTFSKTTGVLKQQSLIILITLLYLTLQRRIVNLVSHQLTQHLSY